MGYFPESAEDLTDSSEKKMVSTVDHSEIEREAKTWEVRKALNLPYGGASLTTIHKHEGVWKDPQNIPD